MHEGRIGFQPDLVARIELMTLAEHRDDLLSAKLGEDLGFRTGRLDDDDLGFRPVVSNSEVFGPDAIDGRPAFRIGGGRRQRQLDAVWALETSAAVRLDLAFEKIHRGRADKAGDELVVRAVI